jgi:hypothetical protein
MDVAGMFQPLMIAIPAQHPHKEGCMSPLHDFPALQLLDAIDCTASAEELAAVTQRDGFVLPISYCDFAQRYGYGLLGNRLLIFIPIHGYGCDFLPTRSPDISAFFEAGVQEDLFEYGTDGSPELILRLIPFGISEDGHYLTWREDEPTGPGEYAIYVIGTKFLSVTRAADTLYKFISACFDSRVKAILGSGYTPLPRTFRPAHRILPIT